MDNPEENEGIMLMGKELDRYENGGEMSGGEITAAEVVKKGGRGS